MCSTVEYGVSVNASGIKKLGVRGFFGKIRVIIGGKLGAGVGGLLSR